MDNWCKEVGIERSKVKYPVLFGKGDNQYPGMMATEEIAPGEIMIKVPSEQIISTKVAYECEPLKEIYYDHPELFGKHIDIADDNMLNTYVLYQISLGKESKHWHAINCWPKEADILMNWDEEDLEWL